jgi:DNA invertase Pin-like site-specific DNA recombinase
MHKLSDRKLSQYQADKIRELNEQGIGQKKLAEHFGISRVAVKAILKNKTYKSCN